jgi:acylphosphatase
VSQCGVHLKIKGLVQGVGYRYFCYRTALDLGVVGWARNLPDGSVEVEAEGDRSLLESFIETLTIGPGHASVRDVVPTWKEFSGKYQSFDIRG